MCVWQLTMANSPTNPSIPTHPTTHVYSLGDALTLSLVNSSWYALSRLCPLNHFHPPTLMHFKWQFRILLTYLHFHTPLHSTRNSSLNTLRPRQMDAISQTTFSNAFSWMKMYEFRLKFHWSLFLRFQLTIFQHWFRYLLGAVQATSHYLNQWWLVYWRIYASLGLNELISQAHYPILCNRIVTPSHVNTDWVDIYLFCQKIRVLYESPMMCLGTLFYF